MQSSSRGIDIGDGDPVVSLDLFSLVRVCVYKRSFTFHNTVLVELVVVNFERAEWLANFETETKNEVFRELSNNGVLKTHGYLQIILVGYLQCK